MLDQQKDAIQNLIVRALAALDVADVVPQLEKPKDPTHGDVACTVAMQLARRLKQNPRAIAETLVAEMKADEAFAALLETVEIAGPGFINFRVAQNARAAIVSQVLRWSICSVPTEVSVGDRGWHARSSMNILRVVWAVRLGVLRCVTWKTLLCSRWTRYKHLF